jgi:hypothetical protein
MLLALQYHFASRVTLHIPCQVLSCSFLFLTSPLFIPLLISPLYLSIYIEPCTVYPSVRTTCCDRDYLSLYLSSLLPHKYTFLYVSLCLCLYLAWPTCYGGVHLSGVYLSAISSVYFSKYLPFWVSMYLSMYLT